MFNNSDIHHIQVYAMYSFYFFELKYIYYYIGFKYKT